MKYKIDWMVLTFILCTMYQPYVHSLVSRSDKDALFALYNATDGINWDYSDVGFSSSWDFTSGSDPCLNSWQGVSCAPKFKIIGLSLLDMNLKGTLPIEIGELTDLQSLSVLTNEALSGSIPSAIGSLVAITYLQLTLLNISGVLPSAICSLSSLANLDISYNPLLTGPIPQCLADLTSLRALYLRCNNHTGPLVTPHPPNIKQLHIINNHLTGTVPGLPDSLERLSISGNSLHGALPHPFNTSSTTSLLDLLAIDFNEFTGTVPSVLASNFPRLSMLRLDSNFFRGSIPSSLATLTALRHFSCIDNELTGPIFPEIGSMTNLAILLLSECIARTP
jgi:Leucine-rich repeat (LRR) protein